MLVFLIPPWPTLLFTVLVLWWWDGVGWAWWSRIHFLKHSSLLWLLDLLPQQIRLWLWHKALLLITSPFESTSYCLACRADQIISRTRGLRCLALSCKANWRWGNMNSSTAISNIATKLWIVLCWPSCLYIQLILQSIFTVLSSVQMLWRLSLRQQMKCGYFSPKPMTRLSCYWIVRMPIFLFSSREDFGFTIPCEA